MNKKRLNANGGDMRLNISLPPEILLSRGIAVAFSGGADSLALLVALRHLCQSAGLPIIALHCNFHLRGLESDADAVFCGEAARKLDIPILVKDFPLTREESREKKESLEMTCRRLRYGWFAEFTGQGYFIAVGHHIEDDRETMMLNLLRGTGLKGLTGMAELDLQRRIYRPLLDYTRQQIEEFLRAEGWDWCTDSTNAVVDVGRNKLRLNVLPALQADFSDAMTGLDSTRRNLADDYKLFRERVEEIIQEITGSTGTEINLMRLRELTGAPARVLYEILKKRGFTHEQCVDMLHRHPGEGYASFDSPQGRVFVNHHIATYFTDYELQGMRADVVTADNLARLVEQVEGLELETVVTDAPLQEVRNRVANATAFFDADSFDTQCGNLTWRQIEHGDRIKPFGMKGRSRLVSDVLSDLHASPVQKMKTRVLADSAGNVLWLAPVRASGSFMVTEHTHRIHILTYKPD